MMSNPHRLRQRELPSEEATKPKAEQLLPVEQCAQEIKELVQQNPTAIIVAETGAGKTTQIPRLVQEALPRGSKIAIIQPRRVAARSVATYVARQRGSRIGGETGYWVRFDRKITERTRLAFMTTGIILNLIQRDPLLSEYQAIIVDEAHERSLEIDLILGLLKHIQARRQEEGLTELKVIVTSATLEKEKFAQYFEGAPLLEIPGREFPVETIYEEDDVDNYIKRAVEIVASLIAREGEEKGDILIFMPGVPEIRETMTRLQRTLGEKIIVLPLHGRLSATAQDRVFRATSRRKVIVATNIAETSVTVPGVTVVIDSGLIRQNQFDPATGIETLITKPHSRSGCTQRRGRAGRIAPGRCYRLYTETDFRNRPEFSTPEIQRVSLSRVVLIMLSFGLSLEQIRQFDFIDPPQPQQLEQAIQELREFGALDEQGNLTREGKIMTKLPLEPALAYLLIENKESPHLNEVTVIASFLATNRSLFRQASTEEEGRKINARRQHFNNPESDFLTFLNIWRAYQRNDYSKQWIEENYLNPQALEEIRKIRQDLLSILREEGIIVNPPALNLDQEQEREKIQQAITKGLIHNLAFRSGRFDYQRLKDGEFFNLSPSSTTFKTTPDLIVTAKIIGSRRQRDRERRYAHFVQAVKPEWLLSTAPDLVQEIPSDRPFYDPEEDQVFCPFHLYLRRDNRVTGSPISKYQRPLSESPKAVQAFAQAIVEGRVEHPLIQEIHDYNREVIKELNNLYDRAQGEITWTTAEGTTQEFKRLGNDYLIQFYRQQLGKISSVREFSAALEKGTISAPALELDPDKIIPPQVQEEIRRNNPDTIILEGDSYEVEYYHSYDGFVAAVKIPLDAIRLLNQEPRLPSGREIKLIVVDSQGKSVFSGVNLEELKQKALQHIQNKLFRQWDSCPAPQELKNFDLTEELPNLPPPIQYGNDPLTGKPFLAYPAVRKAEEWGREVYRIEYFPSAEAAQEAQAEVEELMAQARARKQLGQERKIYLSQAKGLLAKAEALLREIDSNFSDFRTLGVNYSYLAELKSEVERARSQLESSPKKAYESLEKLIAELKKIHERKRQREKYLQIARDKIAETYANCPLCKGKMERVGKGLRCSNVEEHRAQENRIAFQKIKVYDAGEFYEDDTDTVLSQLETDEGKIIAQLVYLVEGWDRCGLIVVRTWEDGDPEAGFWDGKEPFNEINLYDLGRLTSNPRRKSPPKEAKKSPTPTTPSTSPTKTTATGSSSSGTEELDPVEQLAKKWGARIRRK